jgi:hypothetical protein
MNDESTPGECAQKSAVRVAEFRQVVLWPVQLIPTGHGNPAHKPWEYLPSLRGQTLWQPIKDELTADDGAHFSERRYREFVTFLPFAQCFLYGEGRQYSGEADHGAAPIKIFSRSGVVAARIRLRSNGEPIRAKVERVDLYFFYDMDVAILVMEVIGRDLDLAAVLDTQFRFGRAYLSHWESSGQGGNCALGIEWLGHGDTVLAASDYEDKKRYLRFVREQHAPRAAAHWAFLLQPMVQHYSHKEGALCYREIEYQRMPLMSYVACDDITKVSNGDMIRLGLGMPPGDSQAMPYAEQYSHDFDRRYCYDRYWEPDRQGDRQLQTRFLCTGQNFLVVGEDGDKIFSDHDKGVFSQFHHRYFLLFLIAHFQKASLLLLSDRLVSAISRLDVDDVDSSKQFRHDIRKTMQVFLRFTHRYWFHAVSDHIRARDLFRIIIDHLETDSLYEKTRRRMLDMTDYLDGEQLRRQSYTVMRLTVVTILGLIGTMTTGTLGVNHIDATHDTLLRRLDYFMLVFLPVMLLTFCTVVKSRGLSAFLDALSHAQTPWRHKLLLLREVWKGSMRDDD